MEMARGNVAGFRPEAYGVPRDRIGGVRAGEGWACSSGGDDYGQKKTPAGEPAGVFGR